MTKSRVLAVPPTGAGLCCVITAPAENSSRIDARAACPPVLACWILVLLSGLFGCSKPNQAAGSKKLSAIRQSIVDLLPADCTEIKTAVDVSRGVESLEALYKYQSVDLSVVPDAPWAGLSEFRGSVIDGTSHRDLGADFLDAAIISQSFVYWDDGPYRIHLEVCNLDDGCDHLLLEILDQVAAGNT